jgi:UDP-N-acetylglucosamine--N-acetylmuramyl-(pentapeptide) pyrophosphoryl-undecaprenol N-acetylglucosamine transferase
VLGGSQGAQRLNLSVPEALSMMGASELGVRIVHQTGDAMAEGVRRRYDALALPATVHAFIDDMATAYAEATLVVGRAGATTLAELAVVGRPAVLIPFPFAVDDHQRKNAEELERAGAAVVVADADATPERLASILAGLLGGAGEGGGVGVKLEAMAAAAARLGRPDAAERVVDDLEELIRVR